MSLYSHNRQLPTPIDRLRLPSGLTKTDESTWTADDLAACNLTGPYNQPVVDVDFDDATQFWEWSSSQLKYLIKDRPGPKTASSEELAELIRRERNDRLYGCDWTQSADAQLSNAKKTEWATYRQALRDLPSDSSLDRVAMLSDPNHSSWPTVPAK